MTKKLIFCLFICNATNAMYLVYNQLHDTSKTDADIMRFLESFEDFDAQVNVNATAHIHTSLLHAAAWRGFDRTTKFLVEHGSLVNMTDSADWTPLGNAIMSECENETAIQNVVQVLLDAGATPYARISNNQTADKNAIRLALQRRQADLALMLSYPDHILDAFLQTHNKSRAKVLKELKNQEVNLCAASLALQTTIKPFKRRRLRNKCLLKYLLAQTIDYGETPLDTALGFGYTEGVVEIVKCLQYKEIKKVIAYTKYCSFHNVLLKALAAPENYESILQEARDDNNQELIDDLEKVRTP